MAEAEPTIEEALKRLEAIADKLEDPELDLDEAVRLYEEGLRLYDRCAKKLDAAELQITQLADALKRQASSQIGPVSPRAARAGRARCSRGTARDGTRG